MPIIQLTKVAEKIFGSFDEETALEIICKNSDDYLVRNYA